MFLQLRSLSPSVFPVATDVQGENVAALVVVAGEDLDFDKGHSILQNKANATDEDSA